MGKLSIRTTRRVQCFAAGTQLQLLCADGVNESGNAALYILNCLLQLAVIGYTSEHDTSGLSTPDFITPLPLL